MIGDRNTLARKFVRKQTLLLIAQKMAVAAP
jgi:hypothetical protein